MKTSSSAAQRYGSSRDGEDTPSNRKAKFGDTYLSRLGGGGRSAYTPSGTDFSTVKTDPDFEHVRLQKQLAALESQIARVEEATSTRRDNGSRGGKREDTSKPALVKRELEQLLEYKRRELRELESGEGRVKTGGELKGIRGEVESVKEQIEGLEGHFRERERVLEALREEIEREKRG